MRHKYSYEHNIEHNYANLVIKNNKLVYELWHNCSSHGHNIEHDRQLLSIAQKHNW